MGEPRRILRFPASQRIEHAVTMVSFTILAITGLVQKYAMASLSEAIIALLGGIETVRAIHHIFAVVLMLEAIYHLGAVGYRLFVLHQPPSILLSLQDLRAGWQIFLNNLGLSRERPLQGRYTFEEKVEYWALVWGTVVMAVTGFMMWNPIATTRLLPGEFVPAAKAAHGGEAVLAVLAILVWHSYHVHLRQFNKSMFTGYLSEEEMLEEHPLELADLKAGVSPRPLDPAAVARRRRIFLPIYSLLAASMLVGVYFFTSYEHTAITTIPPAEDVVVYVPLTPTPLPTPLPTKPPPAGAPTTWEDGFADLFAEKCGSCHGTAKVGGLDLAEYEGALAGGKSGPAIVPGDPAASRLVIVQATGDHPGQLTGQELALVRAWIEAGAPER